MSQLLLDVLVCIEVGVTAKNTSGNVARIAPMPFINSFLVGLELQIVGDASASREDYFAIYAAPNPSQ
ncbi:hypothetical protein C0993_011590, partial [Termitomyces sp. T159_Od127]